MIESSRGGEAEAPARRDELQRRRARLNELAGAISEAGRLVDERTSTILVLIGLFVVLLVIGSRLIPGAPIVLGNLGPLEFAAALASGVAILVTGAAVRRSSDGVRQAVIRGLSDGERAFYAAARHGPVDKR